jgi:hypothetical protein
MPRRRTLVPGSNAALCGQSVVLMVGRARLDALPHRMQRVAGMGWRGVGCRLGSELAQRAASQPSGKYGTQAPRRIVGGLWAIGGCSPDRTCAGHRASGGSQRRCRTPGCSPMRLGLLGTWSSVHKRYMSADDVGLCARWVLARHGLVGIRWTVRPTTRGLTCTNGTGGLWRDQ